MLFRSDDNFFELGGDSIVSIQLVSRARRAGLLLTPRGVFQHQTVAALAASARLIDESAASAAPELGSGSLPLTPIMHWLRERGGPIDGFNQSMLLRVPAGLGETELAAALQAVLDRHDGLRLRLMVSEAGERGSRDWSLEVLPAGAVHAGSCLRRIDVGDVAEGDFGALVAAEGGAAVRRLSPFSGAMAQAVWFDAGGERAGRLLLTIHHLAVDGVSWRILVPDLAAAWAAIASGRAAARSRPTRPRARISISSLLFTVRMDSIMSSSAMISAFGKSSMRR